MKWTVKLDHIDEAGNFHSETVGHIERPELWSESDLGLTHDDGKFLIRRVQAEIAQDQVRALIPAFPWSSTTDTLRFLDAIVDLGRSTSPQHIS
jgi:hypothetical protein